MSDNDKSAASAEKDKAGEGAGIGSSSSNEQPTTATAPAEQQQQTAEDTEGAATGGEDPSSEEGGSGALMMERLQRLMKEMMRFEGREAEEVPHLLEEVSLEGVARYISSGKCKKIVTMVGAGISTAAGIPDFRSPGSGLYDNLQQYELPTPQAIFMISYFKENPKPFFVLAKELFPGTLKPTLSHYFIRMLHTKGLLLRHYTQNIDTLERVAGVPEDKLVEAHGTFHTAHCMECGADYTLPWMKEQIFADVIPTCTEGDCTGVVKPDIVFFGEQLPPRFAECFSKDLKQCDLLIVMGTSLVVQPFASLVSRVPPAVPRLYINLEKPPAAAEDLVSILVGGGGSFRFDAEDNYRDVFQQVTCDDGCSLLADLLGWGEELQALMKEEHARIDKEMASKGAESKSSPKEGASSSL